ncbi:MAG: glycosyltransferase family 2 protein, partial [Alphaproteobacteria bacterium]|nr:glycosyltransferase family 2 protein [Alphaproteobacteria bacterium]
MAPRVSVLIVNYNSGPHLIRCVEALTQQTMGEFEAIVMDNASTDGSIAPARDRVAGDPRFIFVASERNLGFAAGNNAAATRARAPWIATLNPDAFARPDWLARLLAAVERYPDAIMFGSAQRDARNPNRLDGCGDAYLACGAPWRGGYGDSARTEPDDYETFGPCAAAALYRAAEFRALGGFDESFFCYGEDIDLAFRMRLAGERCIQVKDAVVDHVGGGSGGSGAFARYHGTRNMVWTFAKNMPAALLWPLIVPHLGLLALLCVRA